MGCLFLTSDLFSFLVRLIIFLHHINPRKDALSTMGLFRFITKVFEKGTKASARGKAGENVVAQIIKRQLSTKMDRRYIANLILVDAKNGRSHQIDHVLIRENGIFCIETKNFTGLIFGTGDSDFWVQMISMNEKHEFFNPLIQNQKHCYQISEMLDRQYFVNSLIVMVQNNSEKIRHPNVINVVDLAKYIKNFSRGVTLSQIEMDEIYDKLTSRASNMSNKEHVQNIKEARQERETIICPECGGTLVLMKGRYDMFLGCPECSYTQKAVE